MMIIRQHFFKKSKDKLAIFDNQDGTFTVSYCEKVAHDAGFYSCHPKNFNDSVEASKYFDERKVRDNPFIV